MEMNCCDELDLSDSSFSYCFNDSTFSSRILTGLNDLRLEKKFFDMTICVGEFKFMCHRIVLASASDYFRGMFGGRMRESFSDSVSIFDVDPDTMELLIEFCYTSQVEINTENVERLMKAADLFQFPTIKDACGNFLLKHLHPSNSLNIERFADGLSCSKLAEMSFNYTLQHIVEVTLTKDFMNLNFNKLLEIISHKDLNIDKEENAYEICLFWMKVDVPSRMQYFTRLMERIRFPFIRRIYILTKIETNVLMRNFSLCLDLIKESRDFHNCDLDRHEKYSIRMQPRLSTGIAEVLIILGGCNNDCDELVNAECLNPQNNHCRSRYLAETPENMRGGYSAVVLDNDLFVTGGSDGFQMFNTAWRYKSQLNEWVEISPMLQAREYHASVSMKRSIYVVSVEGCERYDEDTESWNAICSMSYPVNNCSVAACYGKIYCIGSGVIDNKITFQVYNPKIDGWNLLDCDMSVVCQSSFVPSLTALSGKLYFIHEDSRCVIGYDPVKNKWLDRIAPMLQLHLGGSVTQYQGKIVASGGYDERFGLTDTVEMYDPDQNEWSYLTKLSRPMFWHNCVSLFKYVSAPRGDYFFAPATLHDFSEELSSSDVNTTRL
ncbi:kelch-like protein 21 [Styela clava]